MSKISAKTLDKGFNRGKIAIGGKMETNQKSYKVNGEQFGKAVRRLMQGRMTVEELAKKIGKSATACYAQMSGKRDVTLKTVRQFCSALDVTTKELTQAMQDSEE